jgi:hypothetical protein
MSSQTTQDAEHYPYGLPPVTKFLDAWALLCLSVLVMASLGDALPMGLDFWLMAAPGAALLWSAALIATHNYEQWGWRNNMFTHLDSRERKQGSPLHRLFGAVGVSDQGWVLTPLFSGAFFLVAYNLHNWVPITVASAALCAAGAAIMWATRRTAART